MICGQCDKTIVECDCANLQERVESLRHVDPPCVFLSQLLEEFDLCMARRQAIQLKAAYDLISQNNWN